MAAPVAFWEFLKQERQNPTGISSRPHEPHLVLVGQKTRLDHSRTGFCIIRTTHLNK